nr:hypothetical protein [Tanacetum cinerariifolium]
MLPNSVDKGSGVGGVLHFTPEDDMQSSASNALSIGDILFPSRILKNPFSLPIEFSTSTTLSTAGDAVNVASVILDVSVVGPSTSTAGDIFEDEMTTIGDTLMDIRSTRPRITLVVIYNVEKEPMSATPLPTV